MIHVANHFSWTIMNSCFSEVLQPFQVTYIVDMIIPTPLHIATTLQKSCVLKFSILIHLFCFICHLLIVLLFVLRRTASHECQAKRYKTLTGSWDMQIFLGWNSSKGLSPCSAFLKMTKVSESISKSFIEISSTSCVLNLETVFYAVHPQACSKFQHMYWCC